MCFIYSWQFKRSQVWNGLMLPVIVAVAVAIWLAVVGWTLLTTMLLEAKKGVQTNANLTSTEYNTITWERNKLTKSVTNTTTTTPALSVDTVIFKTATAATGLLALAVLWVLVRRVVAVFKPVSEQVMDYLSGPPDHSQRLGYQHHVIRDIQFLLKEARQSAGVFWRVFALLPPFWLSRVTNCTPAGIPKQPLGNDTRIVVFVDDLDRCPSESIMQVNDTRVPWPLCMLMHLVQQDLLTNMVFLACSY